ncbi:MAG: hypothetical protein EB079_00200 [Verrucomicrobia bacterium]|nr:hypothetical protein [Verrucomicrobiota bacterium]
MIKTIRKKYYLFDLSDLFLSQFERPFQFQTFTKTESFFPKDDDKNFNKQVEESETETDVKLLESKLKEAIRTENYELACKLRDQIKKVK